MLVRFAPLIGFCAVGLFARLGTASSLVVIPISSTASVASLSGLVFVLLLVGGFASVSALAALLRRGLPKRPTDSSAPLRPVSFGSSLRTHRSPRYAVLHHRSLVGAFFMALAALFLLPVAPGLREVGVSVIPSAIVFVFPTFLVVLHARRWRSPE